MKNYLYYLLVTSLAICSCGNKQKTQPVEFVTTEVEQKEVRILEPLDETPLSLIDESFGKIIELTGTQKILDGNIFKVSETEMLIKDDYFLMQNAFGNDSIFMLFKLPEFEYLKSFGVRGNAPGQFHFPHLAPTSEEDKLAYIVETHKPRLYSTDYDGSMSQILIEFPAIKGAVRTDKNMFITDSAYYYVDVIRQGRALFKSVEYRDSVSLEMLHNLAFSPKHKNWAAYTGDFLVEPSGKRFAYAYKYFKRILFYDPETGKSRVVEFDKDGVNPANDVITLGPDNVTYYWGGRGTENYIFLTYSGRTPIQVMQDNNKKNSYIYVEQFDWNGNPIRKYKLDHWGRMIADEKNGKLYQITYDYDDPLFVYDLPDIGK